MLLTIPETSGKSSEYFAGARYDNSDIWVKAGLRKRTSIGNLALKSVITTSDKATYSLTSPQELQLAITDESGYFQLDYAGEKKLIVSRKGKTLCKIDMVSAMTPAKTQSSFADIGDVTCR